MPTADDQSSAVLVKAWRKNEIGFEEVFDRYRKRLRRMVVLRLDVRLSGRIDPDDVIQDAFVLAFQKIEEYRSRTDELPLFLWLRLVVAERVIELHRRHLGAKMRDAGREVSIYPGPMPEASSAALAAQLTGRVTSPSNVAIRAEIRLQVQEALNRMDPIDREVLTLRNFELLSNSEAAQVLGISQPAASNRYVKALRRMKDILSIAQGEG